MKNKPSLYLVALAAVAFSHVVSAEEVYTPAATPSEKPYFTKVTDKFIGGFTNLFTGLVEVPKNIADSSKKTNFVVGAAGGLLNGTLHTLGRTAAGVFDVLTAPIPIASMVEPQYVWSDFDKPTTYGSHFK